MKNAVTVRIILIKMEAIIESACFKFEGIIDIADKAIQLGSRGDVIPEILCMIIFLFNEYVVISVDTMMHSIISGIKCSLSSDETAINAETIIFVRVIISVAILFKDFIK